MQPTSDNDFAPPSENQCSQSKCKANLPVGYKYKSCEKCRNTSRLSMQKKRKREKVDEGPHRQQATAPGNSSTTEKGPIEYLYVESGTEPTSDESKVSNIMGFVEDSYQ